MSRTAHPLRRKQRHASRHGPAIPAGPKPGEDIMTMTATTTDHVAIVSDLYAAFGRGDLEAMLAPLAEDVSWDADWADLFSQRAGLGVVAPRHGIDGAREFFVLLDTFQVHDFRVLDLLASPTQVVAQ